MMEIDDKSVTVDVGEAFIVKTDAGDLCRLCANTDNQLIPIFRGEGLEHNLSVKIETHLPIIKVTEIDKLPLHVCYQCASTLISWHNLYEGCRVADKRLREILAIDKFYQEDEAYADYVDDYRDDYDEETHESLSTSATNTSNLESNSLKDNPTEVSTLNDTKTLNETELYRNDERWSDCDSGDDNDDDDFDDDYNYEYYYNDDDDRLTKVAQRSASEKQLLKLQKQQRQRRRTASIPGTSKRPTLSCTVIDDGHDGETASAIDVCNCVLSRSRCERCAKLARFKCYYCPMVFLKVDQRNCHLRVSHRTELLKNSFELFCKVGRNVEKSEEDRMDEMSVNLNRFSERIRYECHTCADSFGDKVSLIGHLKNHRIRERAQKKKNLKVDSSLGKINGNLDCRKHQSVVVSTKPRSNVKNTRTPRVYVPRKTSSRSRSVAAPATEVVTDYITYECANCGEIFNTKAEIKIHLRLIHGFAVAKIPEDFTPSVNKTEAKLIRELAKKSFKRSETTTPNSVSESLSTAGYYICAVCGQIFLKRHSFTRHVNLHSSSRYDCDKCKKSFTTKAALLSHQNLKHKDLPKNIFFLNGRKYLKCEQCPFTCRNERNKMEEHMRVHTGEKPFTCELCGKQFRTRALLRVHTRYVHEGVKEHACDMCGRCFSNKRYMEEHRRIHTGEKPLICDLCGKTFRQNSSLTKHVENHLGIKKHACHLCNKRFSNSHHLSIHIKRHMGEANFVCDQCGKGFVDKYQLKNHRVVHSEERPFVCVICGTGFKLLKHLKQHGRTHRTV